MTTRILEIGIGLVLLYCAMYVLMNLLRARLPKLPGMGKHGKKSAQIDPSTGTVYIDGEAIKISGYYKPPEKKKKRPAHKVRYW